VEGVLVEGPSKKDAGVTTGRTRQGKLVHFGPSRPLRAGTYADVEITDAAPHHLRGRFVEVTAGPTHRTRIPVVAS
jgi:tRNA-2-methylthio-N6-dimethylallyladenosine synthase